ncbi:MAG: ScyD/ScyE family protein [Candidatus Nanopelagicales bacterium]|jgi:hypothetical protein|nr:ScyD/ScyE family protein [Candidatus Nanopelagicales bacterium]
MHPQRGRSVAAGLAAGLALSLPAAATANAAPIPERKDPAVRTVFSGLSAPVLGLAVKDGQTFAAETFAGTVKHVNRVGRAYDIIAEPGEVINGVAKGPRHAIYYLLGKGDPAGPPQGVLKRFRNGQVATLADLAAHETATNPDAVNSYGFQGLSEACRAQFPPPAPPGPEGPGGPGPDAMPGGVDSNPYAVAVSSRGTAYVADAGGNSIVRVSRSGAMSTLAVLPPLPFVVTAAAQAALGLPACTQGATYNFEPVPTDVELRRGWLYVSLLPGGPEDASLGARGAVVKVSTRTGEVRPVASGFVGAVDLAVDTRGRVYVAEMFASRVSKVVRGAPRPVLDVPFPGAIEYSAGRLWVSSSASLGFLQGQPTQAKVIRFRP